jgi:hypothetical protein
VEPLAVNERLHTFLSTKKQKNGRSKKQFHCNRLCLRRVGQAVLCHRRKPRIARLELPYNMTRALANGSCVSNPVNARTATASAYTKSGALARSPYCYDSKRHESQQRTRRKEGAFRPLRTVHSDTERRKKSPCRRDTGSLAHRFSCQGPAVGAKEVASRCCSLNRPP